MMKFALFSLLFLSLSLQGQVNPDALWNTWSESEDKDSTAIIALAKLSSHFLNTKPDSSIALAQILYDEADSRDLEFWKAEALQKLGIGYLRIGDLNQSLEYFDRSLPHFVNVGNRKGEAGTLINKGMIFMNRGDYPGALEFF